MKPQTIAILVLIVLVVGGSIAGGWYLHKSTVKNSTDRDTVIRIVPGAISYLKDTTEAHLLRLQITVSEKRRLEARRYYEGLINDLNAPDTGDGTSIPVATMDSTLMRYVGISPGIKQLVTDTVHVEYALPPINAFQNLTVRLGPTPFRVDSITVTRVETEMTSWIHDAKYLAIGAGVGAGAVLVITGARALLKR
jgi:hypothetical protein